MKRLKENHPTLIKFQKLMDAAEKLGINLSVNDYGGWELYDNDFPNRQFNIIDLDTNDARIQNFPPTFDYKIIYEE